MRMISNLIHLRVLRVSSQQLTSKKERKKEFISLVSIKYNIEYIYNLS